MSALLMVFYWVLFPLGVYQSARWLFRRAKHPVPKGLVVVGAIGIFAWFLWIAIGRNMWLDQQVREMCAKDGGVKVYETVELTPDLLDKAGRISIPFKRQAKLSDKFYVETDKFYFRKDDPIFYRYQYQIIRQNDGKILGESISYHRGGGGLSGPWFPSGFSCPDRKQGPKFEPSIFIKGDKK